MSDLNSPEDPPVAPFDGAREDAELAELREALEALRAQIQQRFDPGAARESLGLPGESLLQRLRSSLSTLGMSERSGEVDEFGMDELALRRARPLLDLLADRYWRIALEGVGSIPEKGPCLFVANRSGILPYDGLMLAHVLERQRPHAGRPRFFVADWLFAQPFVQPALSRIGAVRACRENADRLLRSGRFVIAFPEGYKGAVKVFRERYRIQRFGRGGVVRIALEHQVPLVPVGIVGAEEAHPILFRWGLPARPFGLPFVPVTPTFPLLGPIGLLPLPTRWTVRVGEPICLDHLEPDAASDELLISRLTADLRARIQGLVDDGISERRSLWS